MNLVELDPPMAAEKVNRLREVMTRDFVLLSQEMIGAASKLSREGLIDSLGSFFDNLEAALSDGLNVLNESESSKIGAQHGKVRAQQKWFSVDDISVEYRILMRVLLNHLREGALLTPEVETIVTDAVLRGIGNAVSSYTEFRQFALRNFNDHSRIKLERALEKGQSELESFFMHADDPMFMTVGRNHRLILANDPFEKFVKKRPLGESLLEIFEKAEVDDLTRSLDTVFNSGTYVVENSIRLMGNSSKIYLHPRWDAQGAVKGIMGIIQVPDEVVLRPKRIFIEVKHSHP